MKVVDSADDPPYDQLAQKIEVSNPDRLGVFEHDFLFDEGEDAAI